MYQESLVKFIKHFNKNTRMNSKTIIAITFLMFFSIKIFSQDKQKEFDEAIAKLTFVLDKVVDRKHIGDDKEAMQIIENTEIILNLMYPNIPSDYDTYYWLGSAYEYMSKLSGEKQMEYCDKAISNLKKATEHTSDSDTRQTLFYHIQFIEEEKKAITFWTDHNLNDNNNISYYESYLVSFPNSAKVYLAKSKLAASYAKAGDNSLKQGRWSSAVYCYQKAREYGDVPELSKNLAEAQDELFFLRIKQKPTVKDCDKYLENYPAGKHIQEVKKIRRNQGYGYKRHHAYIYEQSPINGSSDMNGMFSYFLRHEGFGNYVSFRANKFFFAAKRAMADFESDKYNSQYLNDDKLSSAVLSFGVTKKLYLPIFIYGGVGIGMNNVSKRYKIIDIEMDYAHSYWLYDKQNISWYINPEAGLVIDIHPVPLSIFGGIKYPIVLNNSDKFDYKKIIFSCGIGVVFSSYSRSNIYLAYILDLPNPSNVDFFTNSSMGLSVGNVNGFYGTVRVNPLLFYRDAKYSEIEKGNLFATIGYSFRLIYPLHVYFGAGLAYQRLLKENTVQKEHKLNPELGVNYRIARMLLRAGVNIPNLTINHDNIYYSFGIGYIW